MFQNLKTEFNDVLGNLVSFGCVITKLAMGWDSERMMN
jgi:hypothetical protein